MRRYPNIPGPKQVRDEMEARTREATEALIIRICESLTNTAPDENDVICITLEFDKRHVDLSAVESRLRRSQWNALVMPPEEAGGLDRLIVADTLIDAQGRLNVSS